MTLDYGLLIPAKEQYAGECLEGGSYLQEGDWVTLDNGLLNPANKQYAGEDSENS